mgnify:CR=1 FL=1
MGEAEPMSTEALAAAGAGAGAEAGAAAAPVQQEGAVQLYDPAFDDVDVLALRKLGLQVRLRGRLPRALPRSMQPCIWGSWVRSRMLVVTHVTGVHEHDSGRWGVVDTGPN